MSTEDGLIAVPEAQVNASPPAVSRRLLVTGLIAGLLAAGGGFGIARMERTEEERSVLSSALVIAVANRNVEETERLLARGADPNARFNAPRHASIFDRAAFLFGLLRKPDPGDPVLVLAADANEVPLLKLLLQHGADVTLKDASGRTALDLAIKKNDVEAQRLLRSYGARQ